MLPFSAESLFAFIGNYNSTVWPAAAVAFLFGLIIPWFTKSRGNVLPRLSFLMIGSVWAWIGWVFYLTHFDPMFFGAPYYGAAFLIQGLLFVGAGLWAKTLNPIKTISSALAIIIMLYAIVGYPLVDGYLTGAISEARFFGISPAPSVLYTFGFLLLLPPRIALKMAIIPFVAAGAVAYEALVLDLYRDLIVPAGAVVALILKFQLLRVERQAKAVLIEG